MLKNDQFFLKSTNLTVKSTKNARRTQFLACFSVFLTVDDQKLLGIAQNRLKSTKNALKSTIFTAKSTNFAQNRPKTT
ncbi:hypothetical protein B0680_05865 [Moraxella pluranimalium]|uniref:Uncharacterized protein n=1 Tax=Moraxella pluranimalium TaxID=470453 RepID=A0A1T0CNU6_9GAMM|nr:hypothetical protein B0680_05865 [Moraxella pluranimalium]